MTRNLSAIEGAPINSQNRLRVLSVIELLESWTKSVTPTDANRTARTNAAIDLMALRAAISPTPTSRVGADVFVHDPAVDASPVLSYSLACHLVRWTGTPFADVDVRQLFTHGIEDAAARAFLPDDPELRTAPDEPGYAALLAKFPASDEVLIDSP